MRRFTVIALIVVLAFAGAAVAKDKVFGKGITEGEFTKISTILEKPAKFAGESVRVEGVAVGVCTHRGCWLELASEKQGETLRIKVEDGVIVFPREIIGETVKAEGVFAINKNTEACASAHDDELGTKAALCITTYQIDCIGATVDWK